MFSNPRHIGTGGSRDADWVLVMLRFCDAVCTIYSPDQVHNVVGRDSQYYISTLFISGHHRSAILAAAWRQKASEGFILDYKRLTVTL